MRECLWFDSVILAADEGTSTLTKWLKAVGNILAELSSLGVLGCRPHPKADELKRAGQEFQQKILAGLPSLMQSSGETVRSYVAT